MNIADLTHKIKKIINPIKKATNGEVGTVLMIILVGFAGFGLGKLSSQENNNQPVTIRNIENTTASVGSITENREGGLIVASKKGTKYHYPWCSGAKRMNEENKIFFNSIEEAREAGYTPAGNCKGLK